MLERVRTELNLNENNILDRFFRSGIYEKDKVFSTISPSMDIQIASNFERLLYDINNYDGIKVSELMDGLNKKGKIKVNKKFSRKPPANKRTGNH